MIQRIQIMQVNVYSIEFLFKHNYFPQSCWFVMNLEFHKDLTLWIFKMFQ